MNVIKVLHIAPTPFFSDRGCHIRIRNEIESLAAHSVSPLLCTYHLGEDVERIDVRRIPVIPGYVKRDAGFSPFKFPADVLLFFLVLKTCLRERPDILHGHLHEGVLIGWAVKMLLFWRRLSLVMDMQGSLSGELVGYGTLKSKSLMTRLVGLVEGLICRLPDFFLCSSAASEQTLRQRFQVAAEKIIVLQDVVPDAFFLERDRAALRRRFGIPEGRRVLLYTGSLLPGKGVPHLLEALKILRDQGRNPVLVLLGYPLDAIAPLVEQNGWQDDVFLPGQVAYADLPDWLAVGDVALEPKESTTGEASGKLLHYMAAGLPVACFATENNRKFLGEAGYYASETSADALAQAIASALDDPQAAERGAAGREVICRQYTMAAVGQTLAGLYQKIEF